MLENDSTPATASPETSNNKKCTSETISVNMLENDSTPATASPETSNNKKFTSGTIPVNMLENDSTPATASPETSNNKKYTSETIPVIMLENDSTPATTSPETSNNKKCTSALKLVPAERQHVEEELLHVDPQMINSTSPPPVWATLQSSRNYSALNASEIKSGTTLNRVYNIENAEVNPNFMNKGRKDKSKELNKTQHYPSDKVPNREQLRRKLKTNEPISITVKPHTQIKNQEKSSAEKAQLQPQAQPPQPQALPQRQPQFQPPPQPSPSERKKRLENRLTTKIWQILSRDMFLLDHEKFNTHIQATNSETKDYIINVIKKCNNKQIKRLNRSKVTQTCKVNRYSDKKRAMKIAVRRRVWSLAKTAMKRSKHWTQFLTDNHIIVENIDIDKLDLSFIDFEALEIENKILKRIITWLFS